MLLLLFVTFTNLWSLEVGGPFKLIFEHGVHLSHLIRRYINTVMFDLIIHPSNASLCFQTSGSSFVGL